MNKIEKWVVGLVIAIFIICFCIDTFAMNFIPNRVYQSSELPTLKVFGNDSIDVVQFKMCYNAQITCSGSCIQNDGNYAWTYIKETNGYCNAKVTRLRATHCDSCIMYEKVLNETCSSVPKIQGLPINGLSVSGKYYCVWTKGRNASEISRTENHEIAHQLVFRDYNHFCIDAIGR